MLVDGQVLSTQVRVGNPSRELDELVMRLAELGVAVVVSAERIERLDARERDEEIERVVGRLKRRERLERTDRVSCGEKRERERETGVVARRPAPGSVDQSLLGEPEPEGRPCRDANGRNPPPTRAARPRPW